jgi:GNAT superfamily N-acetyltransferase
MRTGPDFEESYALADDTRIVIRHARADDGPAIRRAFEELSPESRYRRYFHAVASLSDATVQELTHADGHDHVVLVATIEAPDLKSERGVGLARFVRLKDDPGVAEAAITVIDAMQGKGVGRLLAIALGEAAHERGVSRFRAEVLASNAPMRALLDELGAVVVRDAGDAIVFDIPLEEPRPERSAALARWMRAIAARLAGAVHVYGEDA